MVHLIEWDGERDCPVCEAVVDRQNLIDRALAAEANNARLRQWVNDLQSGMYINCVYCGHRYGPDDEVPATMAEALYEHIAQCPEHPLSQCKAENAKLREVLDLVPPLLNQIRGFANDAFGGPSSVTDCIDLILAEAKAALEDANARSS